MVTKALVIVLLLLQGTGERAFAYLGSTVNYWLTKPSDAPIDPYVNRPPWDQELDPPNSKAIRPLIIFMCLFLLEKILLICASKERVPYRVNVDPCIIH